MGRLEEVAGSCAGAVREEPRKKPWKSEPLVGRVEEGMPEGSVVALTVC